MPYCRILLADFSKKSVYSGRALKTRSGTVKHSCGGIGGLEIVEIRTLQLSSQTNGEEYRYGIWLEEGGGGAPASFTYAYL